MNDGSKNITISPIHLEKLRQGVPDARHELYILYSARMFSLCLRYAGSNEEAEDLLHEGFIQVFLCIHQFRGEGSLEGLMRRVFINTAIRQYNKKKNQNAKVFEAFSPGHEIADLSGFDNMALQDMLKIIQSLSDGYRTVFNLFAIEGFSHREISQMLNITEAKSKTQLYRAKSILQKTLINIDSLM